MEILRNENLEKLNLFRLQKSTLWSNFFSQRRIEKSIRIISFLVFRAFSITFQSSVKFPEIFGCFARYSWSFLVNNFNFYSNNENEFLLEKRVIVYYFKLSIFFWFSFILFSFHVLSSLFLNFCLLFFSIRISSSLLF